MRTAILFVLTLEASLTARADFSYTTTTKISGGMLAGAANNRITKHYLKGQKMKIDSGDSVMLIDFDAQTITHINNSQQTYSVTKFSEVGQAFQQAGAEVTVDVKETGQKRTINGYNASEVILSMDMESSQSRQPGMKMRMDIDMWISPDVPGSQEMRAFYERNRGKFPWAAMAGGGGRGDQGMQKGMIALQRKMAGMKGVPVLQVIKMSMGAPGGDAQAQKMKEAMAQLEAMKKQGNLPPQAAEALSRMGGGSSGGALSETTVESSSFSGSSIPESVFAIPAGYKQTEHK
jgi:uncharacterized protein DUF4412